MSAKTAVATAQDGAQIAYEVHAAAGRRRLVLIHSLGLDLSVWGPFIEEVRGTFEVLAYDCRGHGRSTRTDAPFDVDQFAGDLEAVMDAAGFEAAIVVGCSMGGGVAQALAATRPDRVEALVLVDTTAWYGDGAPAFWSGRAEAARKDGLESIVDFQIGRWFSEGFAAARPDLVSHYRNVFVRGDVESFAATCGLLASMDLRGRLAGWSKPAAIIVGEDDLATPRAMSEQLQQELPGAELVILTGARHLTPIEAPGSVAEVVQQVASA